MTVDTVGEGVGAAGVCRTERETGRAIGGVGFAVVRPRGGWGQRIGLAGGCRLMARWVHRAEHWMVCGGGRMHDRDCGTRCGPNLSTRDSDADGRVGVMGPPVEALLVVDGHIDRREAGGGRPKGLIVGGMCGGACDGMRKVALYRDTEFDQPRVRPGTIEQPIAYVPQDRMLF